MTDRMTMGRRDVLAGMGGLIGGAALAGQAAAAVTAAPAAGRSLMTECGYGDVTLLDGPVRKQFDQTLAALIAMDDDALLRPFRVAAGLPVGPNKLGGWYDAAEGFDPPRDMHGFIPGHSFGQYISALSRGYAVSGDAAAKAKVDRLIAGFAPTITPDFYKDYPLPAYTYDKTLMGLLDAYAFTGNQQALKLIGPATDAVLPYLPGRAQDRQLVKVPPGRNAAFGWDETYTLPENFYIAAERGAGDRFHGLARAYLLDDTYFNPLADGRNVLPGRHAYSHVNALASAMRAYMVDGDPRHLAAARNGLQFVLNQSWATGGWGPNESFVEPGSGGLGNSLTTTHSSFEAPCGTYGHFKVARYLMRATGDSRYGDAMEKLMYNASLGALPLRPDGSAYYYADYSEIGAKSYFEYNCPCCSGSIGQLAADYGPSAYLRDDKGVFVNLYIPSRVVWRRDGAPALTLTQQGGYPLGSDIAMAVEAPRPVKMALRLRIPAWAGPQTRLLVNGRAVGGVAPGRFAVVAREWRNGDKVALSIDRPLRLEPVDAQHPARVAAMQGPLALFAMGDRFVPLTSAQLLSLKQTAPGAAEWTLAADVGRLRFYPSSAIGTEPTRLYQFLI
ncbi:beta-L-arabinofuranosidase domain-containing protein [Sphingomonas sp. CROZ-RG-20F-R02-07]|uniref:beta-L-arabinofuranosidase domain-containing protein n=1 Tax=Sphingomonas sp. CROZ-RG-20F-R02-07 TaxID=2914832 RepID=UPI001F577A50|nr:beta-L-arabinofuranosidase domain-containing protein [Sphingomonas sp. CROZ-RG-20F-R02-07]